MNRTMLVFSLAATAGIAGPARAEDPRLVQRQYSPNEVVLIEGKPTVQATVRFADDEHIENVAIGDSSKWQVTPNKRANLLFLKPMVDRATTNMTVVTDRRTYLFDLVANPLARNPVYILSFAYARDDVAAAVAKPAAISNTEEEKAVAAARAAADAAQLNYAWRHKGAAKVLPSRIFDDGQSTFLSWPAGTTLPAILVKDDHGTEGPVNYAVRDGVTAVEGVPHEIVLRSGRDVAVLTNEGPRRVAKTLPMTRAMLAQAASGGTRK